MKRSILTPEQAAWLAATMDRRREQFGGWTMMADDDSGSADDADSDNDADDSDDDDADDQDDDKVDWKAKFEAQQRINRGLERKGRRDLARIKELEGKSPKPENKPATKADEIDPDEIRQKARDEARSEVIRERVEDKIEAKARAFADPEDAVAVLLRTHDINDFLDGDKIDAEAIADALKDLGEKKPHLLAQGGKRFQGDADGGSRKDKPGRAKSLGDAIARHYDKS